MDLGTVKRKRKHFTLRAGLHLFPGSDRIGSDRHPNILYTWLPDLVHPGWLEGSRALHVGQPGHGHAEALVWPVLLRPVVFDHLMVQFRGGRE